MQLDYKSYILRCLIILNGNIALEKYLKQSKYSGLTLQLKQPLLQKRIWHWLLF
jgi:hypothetical protein